MQLPRDGAENVHLTLTATPPDATIEGSLDERETWFPITDLDDDGHPVFLAVGPDYDGTATGQPVATTRRLWVRAVGNPETVVRPAGVIHLV